VLPNTELSEDLYLLYMPNWKCLFVIFNKLGSAQFWNDTDGSFGVKTYKFRKSFMPFYVILERLSWQRVLPHPKLSVEYGIIGSEESIAETDRICAGTRSSVIFSDNFFTIQHWTLSPSIYQLTFFGPPLALWWHSSSLSHHPCWLLHIDIERQLGTSCPLQASADILWCS